MQATVHLVDAASAGASEHVTLVTDAGILMDVPPAVLANSGLRLLRVGQRVTVTVGEDRIVTRLRIVGVGDGEPIA